MSRTRRPYAGEVTKAYLKQKLGIEHVSTDGAVVICKGKQLNISISKRTKKPYGNVTLYDPEIRAAVPKEERNSYTGNISIGIHVLNYVWNVADKPEGMVIDHIDNDPTNNDVSNLQMMTQKENLVKEHPEWHQSELKCDLRKPRSFYEKKLEGYEFALEQAKQMHDDVGAHHLRTNVSQTRARLRYYDSHIEEARVVEQAKQAEEAEKQAKRELVKKKKELQYRVDHTRKMYQELLEAYGKDDPIVEEYWGHWKVAVAMLQGFKEKHKRNSQ